MRFLNSLLAAIAVIGITAGLSNAQEKSQTKNKDATHREVNHDESTMPYLGVAVETLHEAFASQMPKTLSKGQGVLVEKVAANSPAAKAGLQPHDIITMYDDQKVFSVDQLLHLIQADKIGREAKLQFVRAGKFTTADVKLGQRPAHHHLASEFEHWIEEEFSPFHVSHKPQHASKDQSKTEGWESFDSMTLTKLKDGRYRAQMTYLGKDDKIHELKYEGTREEIRKKINNDKELRDSERDHLLRGLDLRDEVDLEIPAVQIIPGRGVLIEVPQPDF